MRTLTAALAVAITVVAREGMSQQPDTARRDSARAELTVPREVAIDVAWLYNQPAALRAVGRTEVRAGQTVSGDVAVLGGPLIVAGRIDGRVVFVNGDVSFQRGAVVARNLIVVGGIIDGRELATIGGEVRWYPQPMRYQVEEDRLVIPDEVATEEETEVGWLRRWLRRDNESDTRPVLWTANPYNRVEGLPISVGVAFRERAPRRRVAVDLLGIIRSADSFEWDGDNIGHDAHASVRFGGDRGVVVGGRVYDVVEPVERWQLRDTEVGLAAFFFHKDYRDYYNRHGGSLYVTLDDGAGASLTLSYADERWGARSDRDPFSLFEDGDSWRPNPQMDQGKLRLLSARVGYDTRNDEWDPWTGWLISAEVERGRGNDVSLAPASVLARTPTSGRADVSYTRAFLDARRYNRVSPKGQLNFRLVLGGWLGGDDLPLQRRFSLGGAGALPGYDFRAGGRNGQLLDCAESTAPSGSPAQCERMALAQVEYRGDLRIAIGGRTTDGPADERGPLDIDFNRVLSWVIFFDVGRGWLVG
ncbi:MAG TPA: BamA/TamA family outer membrane protein, partial [Gemmatimonadaceae bacterium]|nr:BamA/TamA family outer membrane protein [Gemmatimonadaceae bacterium]